MGKKSLIESRLMEMDDFDDDFEGSIEEITPTKTKKEKKTKSSKKEKNDKSEKNDIEEKINTVSSSEQPNETVENSDESIDVNEEDKLLIFSANNEINDTELTEAEQLKDSLKKKKIEKNYSATIAKKNDKRRFVRWMPV